jgi:hypothetical protein
VQKSFVQWLMLVLTVVTASMVVSAAAQATEPPKERLLERSREEAGLGRLPTQRFGVPAGRLAVSPGEIVAGAPGQRIRFTVTLSEGVPGATLSVWLPRRWTERARSGIVAVRTPRLTGSARGRARMRRAGRVVELAFDEAAAGTQASFEVENVGIPAGSYRLPFSWRDQAGRAAKAGVATVRVYARPREEPEGSNLLRLANPGMSANVASDGIEESETFIAVTPGNSDRIAVGSNWNNSSMPLWITGDGGQSWSRPVMPQTIDAPGQSSNETGTVCCDPMFAASSAGDIWYGGLSLQRGGAPSRIVVNRVAAGGSSLQPVTTGLPTRTNGTQDKPLMTIDDAPASPTFGRLYVVWDEPASAGVNIALSACDTRPGGIYQPARCDNADNWSAPVSVTKAAGSYIYPDVGVGPDGRTYVSWWDYSNANAIRGATCSSGCTTTTGWSAAQTTAILDTTGGVPVPFACPIVAQPGGRAAPAPQLEVDHSTGPNGGRVYVVWSDLRAGSGATRCSESPVTGNGTPPLLTHLNFDSFVASAPAAMPGANASSPSVGTRLITEGEGAGQPSSDDWFPALAVDDSTGQAWADLYSTREDPTRRTTHFYARSVTPTGSSHNLGALTRVSSAASDYSASPCCEFGNDYGDYTGIAATEGIAYPVWTDNSSGDGEPFTYVRQPAAQQPAAITGPAPEVGQTDATVTGAVNPNGQATSYRFEYGTTNAYGSTTSAANAGSGTASTSVSSRLSGLAPAATYHYRLVATSAAGTHSGADMTFTTASASVSPGSLPLVPGSYTTPGFSPVGPVMRVSTKGVRLSRRGRVGIEVRCLASRPGPCVGVLRLVSVKRYRVGGARLHVGLGSARFRIDPGRAGVVTMSITRPGRRLLRRFKRVRAVAAARATAGTRKTTRARLTVRAR